MSSEQVITLNDPVGLLLTSELLQKIGVHLGDQIEIRVSEQMLTVRPINESNAQKTKLGTDEEVKEISFRQSATAGATSTLDDLMRDLLERRRAVYEKLAEGAQ